MSLTERIPRRHRGTTALIAVLIGSTGIQTTSAVATTLFEKFSPVSVSGLRMTTAAVVLLLIARPKFWRFTRRDWLSVVSYGVVSSLMNVFFYLAVDRIPLGVAVTIEYLGAFAVAMFGVRKFKDGLFAVGALAGVVLIAGPTFGSTDLLGYVFAVMAAASMTGYTLLSGKIGSGTEATAGIRGLSVSIAIGAIMWSPATALALPHMTVGDWGIAVFIGAVGLALAFSCDAFAATMTNPAVVGVFFSLDPVVSSLVGLALLGELLSASAYIGIALIVLSGAAVTWRANRSAAVITTHTEALQVIRTAQMPQTPRE
ncbi:EamA family transporter [Kocuria koreensis]|uniref:EamA family transporter n=1 Tax=Rothia koreensis TaxID=592378 RepID=A0A7K1LES2_9MICC|nr:EamA family transporter [Rothia koreensis]MUN53695.1 EamA family transporter [Rothia koreensis]